MSIIIIILLTISTHIPVQKLLAEETQIKNNPAPAVRVFENSSQLAAGTGNYNMESLV